MTILKNVLKIHSIMVDGNVQQGNVEKKNAFKFYSYLIHNV